MKISDIAKIAGVSKATVSRVLNNSSDVKEETKLKIKEIIEKYNYYPNAVARNLSKRENTTVAVVVPDIEDPFFSGIVKGIIESSDLLGLNVILCVSNESLEKEEENIKMLIEHRVKGIILIPTKRKYTDPKKYELYREKVPIILVDRKINDSFNGIYIDNEKMAYNAAKILIKKVKHGREIGIITGPLENKNAKDRYNGFVRAINETEINVNDTVKYEGDFSLDSGYSISKEVLYNRELKALFISNNMMTLGFISGIVEKNPKFINKLLLFSFEQVNNLEKFKLPIINYNINFKEIGSRSLEYLIDYIDGKECRKEVLLEFSLKNRGIIHE